MTEIPAVPMPVKQADPPPAIPYARAGDDAAARFRSALKRHEPSKDESGRTPHPKLRQGEDDEPASEERSSSKTGARGDGGTIPAGGPPNVSASPPDGLAAGVNLAAATGTHIVAEQLAAKIDALVDTMLLPTEGSDALIVKLNDLSPLDGLKLQRQDSGALALTMTTSALHMPRLKAQLDRLRDRLIARGHDISAIDIDTETDPAARLREGAGSW